MLATASSDWLKRGDDHREVAFALSAGALKKKKVLPIRNWKDAETADKMARRAAGLENEAPINQTLISINERINAHGGDDDEVLEAYVVEEQPPLQLPGQESQPNDQEDQEGDQPGEETAPSADHRTTSNTVPATSSVGS